MIKFDANETDSSVLKMQTILHETQHVRIDQQTLNTNESYGASINAACRLDETSIYSMVVKKDINFYQENLEAIWNPD